MLMDVHDGYLWVLMSVVGCADMVEHGKEAHTGTDGPCGQGFGQDVHAKFTPKQTCIAGVPMGVVFTGGHAWYAQRPERPNKNGQNKQMRKRGDSKPERTHQKSQR